MTSKWLSCQGVPLQEPPYAANQQESKKKGKQGNHKKLVTFWWGTCVGNLVDKWQVQWWGCESHSLTERAIPWWDPQSDDWYQPHQLQTPRQPSLNPHLNCWFCQIYCNYKMSKVVCIWQLLNAQKTLQSQMHAKTFCLNLSSPCWFSCPLIYTNI